MSTIQDPLDRIRQMIDHHKTEAEYARKSYEAACIEAEAHEQARKEHLTAAYKWRKILEREEADTKVTTVRLNLEAAAPLIAAMKQAAKAARPAGEHIAGEDD